MKGKLSVLLGLLLSAAVTSSAQIEKSWIKSRITELSGRAMQGRGYVGKGDRKAANYIRKQFKEFGLKPLDKDSSFFQEHSFSINIFPGDVSLKLNGKEMNPGTDFIVHAASTPYNTKGEVKLKTIDLSKVKDSAAWQKVKKDFKPGEVYFLTGTDTFDKYLKLGLRSFSKELPDNLFIVSKHGKLTWLACTDTVTSTIVYVEDTVLPKNVTTASVSVNSKHLPVYQSQNVCGYVRGTEKPDSFIVFTAHYDHLGRMGKTVFPGAHDNASGTSLVLYLARYFAMHPQKYSVAFMLFSGEEAGLLGSKYYASNPLFPLGQIRFVVNLDMTGDATNGITVVNGAVREKEFEFLENINKQKNYLPKLNKREQTQNSDHYSFSEKNVPAVFIYGNGTKPFYHDVFDVAEEISLENIDNLYKLLVDFTEEITGTN